MLYVAISRVTKLSGLFIIGKFKALQVRPDTDPVAVELQKIKNKQETGAYVQQFVRSSRTNHWISQCCHVQTIFFTYSQRSMVQTL